LDQVFTGRGLSVGPISDDDGDELTYEAVSFPEFLEIKNTGSGTFLLLARGPGEGTILFRADDGNGGTTTVDQEITITAPTSGPPIALHYMDTIRVDPDDLSGGITTVRLDSVFYNPDGGVVTYTAHAGAPGVATSEISGSDAILTPVSRGMGDFSVFAEGASGSAWIVLFMKVGTPSTPPTVTGSFNTVEATVGLPLELDLLSVFSGESLRFEAWFNGEDTSVGGFRTMDDLLEFTGSIPGEGTFQIRASDLFRQQVQIDVPVSVAPSTENFGPFAFEFDQAPGNQGLYFFEDVAPGDIVEVEILIGVTGSGNFAGRLIYDPTQVEPQLDAFVFGEQTGSGSVVVTSDPAIEPYDGVRNRVTLGADLTVEVTPMRLLSAPFTVQPGFTSTARITLDNPWFWDGTGAQTVPGLAVELRAPQSQSGDFDGDGSVGFADFLEFAGSFGKTAPAGSAEAKYDLDGSGDIGFGDFLIFAGAFGTSV
jgi:hypothetical protein